MGLAPEPEAEPGTEHTGQEADLPSLPVGQQLATMGLASQPETELATESGGLIEPEMEATRPSGPRVARTEQQLRTFIRDLLSEGAASGEVRGDVAPEELASYCLHAVAAARSLPPRPRSTGWSASS